MRVSDGGENVFTRIELDIGPGKKGAGEEKEEKRTGRSLDSYEGEPSPTFHIQENLGYAMWRAQTTYQSIFLFLQPSDPVRPILPHALLYILTFYRYTPSVLKPVGRSEEKEEATCLFARKLRSCAQKNAAKRRTKEREREKGGKSE